MPITASYDPEADALYVRLGDAERAKTIEVDDVVYVDVDAEGQAIGLELLYPSLGLDAQKIADRTGLHSRMTEILAAIAAVGAPIAIPTVTGGAHFTTMTTILTHRAEGTIGASGMPDHIAESMPQPPPQIVSAQ
jgi:uncharacterized protein YuzE